MRGIGRYIISGCLLLILWKVFALALGSVVLPSPEIAFQAFGDEIKTLDFWGHFGTSALRVGSAMLLAWMVAFPLGIALGYSRRLDGVISPLVFLTYPIPKIVFLPVFLLLLGLGNASKILMIALIAGYQILVATRDGVMGVDKKHLDSFRSMGGGAWQAVRHVLIPVALPYGFTALRIGTGAGIAVLFFVESFATSQGLGFFIMDSWGRAAYDRMFAGIIGMSLLGVLLYEICNYLERTLCAWKMLESGRVAERRHSHALMSRIETFARMIKFSHTVFALPFALAAVILAHREHPLSFSLLFWILVAMVGARSAAMGFNRIADARYDAKNPRTADRAIPKGVISTRTAGLFVVFFSSLFVWAAAMISPLCFFLSFPVLGVLLSYSYTKRFTSLSHLYLGFSISLAPLGAWIAVTGGFDRSVLTLSLALLTYIAGFDILYACQDTDFDRRTGLFSLPARFGVRIAFQVSAGFHVCSFICFFLLFIVFDMGLVYMAALVLIGVLMVAEHSLVRPHDLTHIQLAFFHVNSAISGVLFFGVLLDEVVRGMM